MGLRVHQLVPPLAGSRTSHGALLLAPEKEAVLTKTKEFDESILLDSVELTCLYPRFATWKKRNPLDKGWSFDYRKFSRLFKRVREVADLGQAKLH
eukprot:5236480-Pyramimonas_sp.AAC.1